MAIAPRSIVASADCNDGSGKAGEPERTTVSGSGRTRRRTRQQPPREPPVGPIAGAGAASHEGQPARAMSLPETDVARVQRWVAEQNERIGGHIDEMRVEMDVDARAITIFECRPPWREDYGPDRTRQEIARLRYTKSTGVWTLYWPDRNSKFHRYEDLEPTPTIDGLLAEIDADPICIFWG